jgi:tRNA threonylcarbamoyladenosine biosynthesis protein TsaE
MKVHGAEAMRALGEKISRALLPGDVLLLQGDLGAGKTTLVQGIAWGLGLDRTRYAQSPTYAIALTYPTTPPLHHLDLYRFGEAPLDHGLLDGYFSDDAITIVEWPSIAADILPQQFFRISIAGDGESREVSVQATPALLSRLPGFSI